MRKLPQFSVNYPITVLMLVLAVLLLGYISFARLGIDLFPDLNNPRIFVEIKAGERPPEEIEQQFVDNIESLSIRQKDVIRVSSVTRVGSAQITVEYAWDKDMDEAFLDLQKSLSSYSQSEDIDELAISQHDPNAAPIMLIGLAHETITDMDALRKAAENYIRNELVRLEGIADVEISGKEVNEVLVQTDPYLLEAFGLTPDAIAGKIQSFNRNVSGGSIVELGRQYIVKGVSVFQSVEDIANIIVAYQQEEGELISQRVPVFLKDVARVELRNKEPDNIVRLNQTRSLALSIYKETRYNTVLAVEELLVALDEIKRALPGYEFTIIQNQGNFITGAINEVKETALIGIFLAVVILFVFLRRIGTTLIIGIAIPISVVATFNLMYFNGLTLNIMTLGGLALGAGMLVDNAIVVMESIFRNLESGLSVREAAITGTAQVGGAITASTITTVVVFLPIVYLHGASGELFKDQAWTVAFSLLSSLFVAIAVMPMLSARFLRETSATTAKKSLTFPWYSAFLRRILAARWVVITAAVILVAAAILLIPRVGSEFIPKADSRAFDIELTLPEGTDLTRTASAVAGIEAMVYEILADEVAHVFVQIGPVGGAGTDAASVFVDENTANFQISLLSESGLSADGAIAALSAVLRGIPDFEVQFSQDQTTLQETMGSDEAPIVVEVRGSDLDRLAVLTEAVKVRMAGLDDLSDIKTSFEDGAPEIEVSVDRLRAGLFNISVDQISNQLQDKLLGKDMGQWEHEGEMKDITLRLPELSLSQFQDVTIESGNQKIRLDELAQIKTGRSPKEIHRNNQTRVGKVTAEVRSDRPFDHIVARIENEITQVALPPGYQAEVTGQEQRRKDSFESLQFALLLAVVLVYMVLAAQFESLIHPFTILLTIPLAGVGAILIFFVMGRPLNIMAYIGIIMLAGIAVNDSIIFVDAINRLKADGSERLEAVIAAGQQRIRPIIMTTMTTILALLPLTFGLGESAALRAPMALAVIGGLVTSTVLTLMVIPCVYLVFDQLREKFSPAAIGG